MQGEGPPAPILPHWLCFHCLLPGRGAGAPVPWFMHVCTTDKRSCLPYPHQPFTHTQSTEQGRALQPALDNTLETQILQ